ncbi:MAG: antibiotic biosynthesis monooxygenase [Gammaproteobacteria bacterium]|nr:MAG: antibiotic biosynthesis monooxygenase [Gammaproteobacteria bacterium]
MVVYVATVWAKPGHEQDVTRFYQNLEPLMREAKGFRKSRILRARTGTMVEAIRKIVTPEEMARHPEPAVKGTHFIIVEEWDSVEARLAFARGPATASRGKDLFPYLLPEHSHEFYEDVALGR